MAAPRLFGILATRAPVVAVLRRGPSYWWHVGAWHLDEPRYEPGAWFRGLLYPQKCDLSPDGRWLAYSALNAEASWPAGDIYEAISRLPWLTALAAWEAGTTYTTGIHFDGARGVTEIGTPDVGDATPVLAKCGLKITRHSHFAVERRRGWTETPDTPNREEGGAWDDRRHVAMEKTRPVGSGGSRLVVEGSYGGFRSLPSYFDPGDLLAAVGRRSDRARRRAVGGLDTRRRIGGGFTARSARDPDAPSTSDRRGVEPRRVGDATGPTAASAMGLRVVTEPVIGIEWTQGVLGGGRRRNARVPLTARSGRPGRASVRG